MSPASCARRRPRRCPPDRLTATRRQAAASLTRVGKRNRQREKLAAPVSEYHDAEGNTLALRGSLTPATRRDYAETLRGGLQQEDARQRAIELLFERLTAAWTIAGMPMTRQKELLARYRMASQGERTFVLDALRTHLAEHFPEMETP